MMIPMKEDTDRFVSVRKSAQSTPINPRGTENMMTGIVVSNGILLVDYTNRLRSRGMELREAVILGGRTRLRPILMTSLCAILALIPMAVGLGEGSESNAPMAIAVIGGLSVSTLLTLVFIPTLYTIFETRFKREIHIEEKERP